MNVTRQMKTGNDESFFTNRLLIQLIFLFSSHIREILYCCRLHESKPVLSNSYRINTLIVLLCVCFHVSSSSSNDYNDQHLQDIISLCVCVHPSLFPLNPSSNSQKQVLNTFLFEWLHHLNPFHPSVMKCVTMNHE